MSAQIPDSQATNVCAWPRPSGRSPRILIVDDTATNRKLLQAILKRDGFELHEAEDGVEALAKSRTLVPDLILLDIMMPFKDGYEVCAELKADSTTANIPVIFLSAKAESEDKIRGLELGAVDYITKPFSRGEILARVRTHLDIRMLSESILEMNRDLRATQKRIDEDLKAAATIQHSLIPSEDWKTRIPELQMDWVFLPCNRVGGDIFNVFRLDQDHVGIYVIDVAGHGVPSAMVTVSVSQSLNPHGGTVLKERLDEPPHYRLPGPAEVCRRLDKEFPFERFDKFLTFAYLLLNVRDGTLRYARAAHPCPILARTDGSLTSLEEGGTIIGLENMVPYTEGIVQLHAGDRIFLCTDGILEYPGPAGARFGDDRLNDVLSLSNLSLGAVGETLLNRVVQFSGGAPASDDVTFLALEYQG